jgi:ubiquinone/menaquinone biosynthesis C-methylase UbiE
MTENTKQVEKFYDESYKHKEMRRHYPNEQLVRFIFREYGKIEIEDRKNIKILEIGCGNANNTWYLCNEGFDVYSIDISEVGIELAKMTLQKWNKHATIIKTDMLELDFEDNFFDTVVDIFSSNCLTMKEFDIYINKIYKILKPNGVYYSYTPSKKSDAFINYLPARKIDECTLNGIYRSTSPFFGNFYSFRFEDPKELKENLEKYGFHTYFLEVYGQTYFNMTEYFEFVTIACKKENVN